MRFETKSGKNDAYLEPDAALIAMVHLAVDGQLRITRIPEITDDEFRRLCASSQALGQNDTQTVPSLIEATIQPPQTM